MEEKYFVNGRKDHGGMTWKQLLYWCFDTMGHYDNDYYLGNRTEKSYRINQLDIESFFSNFRHNANDGTWTKGYWKENPYWEMEQEKDENCRLIAKWELVKKFYKPTWIHPVFNPKKYQVTDSFDRIISSGFIRSEYLKYKPNSEDRVYVPYSSWYIHRYRHYDHDRDFRRCPVPGVGGRWNSHWCKYSGDHSKGLPWKKAWVGDKLYQREIKEEYSVTFTMPDKIPHKHGHKIHRGWKRTRKKAQWMKGGVRKLAPLIF